MAALLMQNDHMQLNKSCFAALRILVMYLQMVVNFLAVCSVPPSRHYLFILFTLVEQCEGYFLGVGGGSLSYGFF